MRRNGWWILALALIVAWAWLQRPHPVASGASLPGVSSQAGAAAPDAAPRDTAISWPADLPEEARDTLGRIQRGGPFAHRQDGAVFQNREHRLPPQPTGYYHEYTVETPGAGDRGARRIIRGGSADTGAAVEYFYSDDHYRSFRRLPPQAAGR